MVESASDLVLVRDASPRITPEEDGLIPNNPVTAAVIKAIFQGGLLARRLVGGWVEEGDRVVFRQQGRSRGCITVWFGDRDGCPIDLKAQWGLVHKLDAFMVDALLVTLLCFCDPARRRPLFPVMEPLPVSARTILKRKGVSRWGRERTELEARLQEAAEILSLLRVDIERYPCVDPRTRRWRSTGLTVTGDQFLRFEPIIFGSECGKNPAWMVMVGQWADLWLNPAAAVWTSPLQAGLIEFDHRANRGPSLLAKKIGLNTWVLWGAARSQTMLERRISSLLETIGELPEPDARGGHWAGRMRDRLDTALILLRENNIFDDVEWPEEFPVGAVRRTRGWSEDWLKSKIRFHRPIHTFPPR